MSVFFQSAITKMPYAVWLLNNTNVFLASLVTGKSKSKVPTDLVTGSQLRLLSFHCILL
jgi:hypothetical protein